MTYDPRPRQRNEDRLRVFISDRYTGEGEVPPCPICGGFALAVSDVLKMESVDNPGLSHKYIAVDCEMCGYAMFFNNDRLPK